ncbi:MAG: cupin domain-containing protein [Cyanobacteria bacterium P01_G01_bin.39]
MAEITSTHWQEQPKSEIFTGINAHQLWQGKIGAKVVVVEIEPGGKWQGFDVHETGSEEIFVVRGTFNDGERDYPAETFIHYPQGSRHIPQSETGCLLLVFNPISE